MAKRKLIRRTFHIETKADESSPRTLIARISTSTPDRSDDVVVPQGMVADNFRKDPVVMLFHNYNDLPIAKATELQVSDSSILAKVQFADEGTYEKADIVYSLYKQGIMNAWSIGFIPLDWEDLPDGGRKFNKWELYEFSAVPIPANPEALTVMRSAGIDDIEVEEIEKHEEEEIEVKDKKEKQEKEAEVTEETESPKETKEEKQEEKKEEATEEVKEVEQKDLAEVVALSYVMGDLKWLVEAFKDNNVSEASTSKMEQALSLLMEVVKEQAILGQKEFKKNDDKEAIAQRIKETNEIQEALVELKELKEGRVLSEKNRKLIATTIDQMKTASDALEKLVETTEPTKDEAAKSAEDPKLKEGAVLILRDAALDAYKTIGIALRDSKDKN